MSNSSAELSASRLQGNLAGSGGGAVVLAGSCTLNCTMVQFRQNTAGTSGGAVAATVNSTFSLQHCAFESNNGNTAGGALYLGENSARGSVSAVTAVNNTAYKGGFAAVYDSAVLNVSSGTFVRNAVGRDGAGGLLYATDMAEVNLRNCKVSGFAQAPGVTGGAFNINGNVKLTLSACTIADYSAGYGGGLAAIKNSSVHAHNCIWRNLTADQLGGGAFFVS
jgi:predicted outer membrane repeat protein